MFITNMVSLLQTYYKVGAIQIPFSKKIFTESVT